MLYSWKEQDKIKGVDGIQSQNQNLHSNNFIIELASVIVVSRIKMVRNPGPKQLLY
jgi:hypothetical protein